MTLSADENVIRDFLILSPSREMIFLGHSFNAMLKEMLLLYLSTQSNEESMSASEKTILYCHAIDFYV